jgi:regulator of protease activity HflC (stomatin/prohibitin superfamily)
MTDVAVLTGYAFLFLLAVLVIVTIHRGVIIVRQGFQAPVERFGRYRTTLHPGLNLIVPFIDRVRRHQNVQETPTTIENLLVITKDNAKVFVDAIVFYQILDSGKAVYEVANLSDAIQKVSTTNIRTAIGALDLDEALSKRDEINERLLRVLDAATEPWGTKVTRVELSDIKPPEDVTKAMALQLTAERERRAAILSAEGVKQSEILKAEGTKQAQILEAEGKLFAANREAEARERLAQAEAAATDVVSRAVANGSIQALNYFIAQKYVEAVAQIGNSENARLVILPIDQSSLVGSIAGIAELIKYTAAQGDGLART